jgi:hypothetical protein
VPLMQNVEDALVASSMELLLADAAVVSAARVQPAELRGSTLFEALAVNFLWDWGIPLEQVRASVL